MLSHYRLVEKIGEGGMGVVWKALDTELNRHVALKILPPELTADPERRLRFKREAQAAAALSHPSIAVIHEVGEHEGTPFIVMEFLEGKSLRNHLHDRPLPLKEWLSLAVPVAEGLAHAHKHGIVHRDLKPDNVMITDEGQVKLLDFGLAKLLEEREERQRSQLSQADTLSEELTREGMLIGTPAYMSPEQARGDAVDARSDTFSFGATLYEMVTGRMAFRGPTPMDTLSAILREQPLPAAEFNADVPSELQRILGKCLEKNPANRYQHTDELATDLRNLKRDLDSGRASIPSEVTVGVAAGRRPSAPTGRRIRAWALAAALVVAAAAIVVGYLQLRAVMKPGESEIASTAAQQAGGEAATPERKMIVVLPFENLGPPEDEYFAAGMTEEITSRLAVVSGLGVISRTSAFQYDRTGKSMKQVGEEFGVDYVLEGTVRWARQADMSRVRITPQLIRVADDTHLWAEAYERVIEDIFQVQSDIAGKVIEQLGVALVEPERRAVESRPTENPEAYNAYLRGMHHARLPGFPEEDLQLALRMFQRAVELDPGFALAHARLARADSVMYHFGYDRTKERRAMARRAVDRALELAPELPEVHHALGLYHYRGHRDYERALEEFAIAEKGLPNSADVLSTIAYVYRRQDRWEEALAKLEKAIELDPMDAIKVDELGETHIFLRRYPDALHYLDRSIALAPDQVRSYELTAETYWRWKGTTEEARAVLEEMPKAETPRATRSWFRQEVYEGKYKAALERLSFSSIEVFKLVFLFHPKALLSAHAYELLNEPQLARDAYDSARVILERELLERPDDYRVHSALGIAFAGLGRKDEAIQEGRRATELYPVSKDALGGSFPVIELAVIYTMVGDHDAALDRIEYLLSIPSWISVPFLRLDPKWRSLWDHPRFKALEKRFG
jgi:TolB-like protein/Flp pilus assembly protein TadD